MPSEFAAALLITPENVVSAELLMVKNWTFVWMKMRPDSVRFCEPLTCKFVQPAAVEAELLFTSA